MSPRKKPAKPQAKPWTLKQATNIINALARDKNLCLSLSEHAKERSHERDIIIGDMLYVLERGHVLDKPEETTRPGIYKYAVCGRTPSSERRRINLVIVVVSQKTPEIKIITVMWRDEVMRGR